MKALALALALSTTVPLALAGGGQCYSPDGIRVICRLESEGITPWDFRGDGNSPRIYQNGEFRGNLNNNRFDPNSISNPYGRYGSPYSPDSLNNPYGAGNPYNQGGW